MSQGPKLTGIIVILACAAAVTGTGAALSFMYLDGPPPRSGELRDPPQTHSENTTNYPNAHNRGTLDNPFIVRTIRTEEEANQASDERNEKSTNDRRIVWFTGGLAIATLALVVYTGVLSHATRRLVRDAKETAKRELRAYVSIAVGEIKIIEVGRETIIEAVGVNHGKTPAHNVRYCGSIEILDHPLPYDFHMSEPIGEATSGTVLFPGKESKSTCTRAAKLTLEEANRLTSSDVSRVYIHGSVIYEDVFGETQNSQFLASIPSSDIQPLMTPGTGEVEVRFIYNREHTKAT